MRIMLAHSQYRWPGGEETTVRNQKQALEERGHEVLLHVVENPTKPMQSLGALAMAPFNPFEYRSARAAIREHEPDVVHVHNTWFQLSPAIFKAAEDAGVPTVATIQNYRLACPQGQFFRDGQPCTDCLGRFPWPGVRHACYRDSRVLSTLNGLTTSVSRTLGWLESVSAFVVPSEFGREILSRAGLPEDRTHVIYNAVPDPGPRPNPPSASRTIAFVGRLSPEKGVEELARAFAELDVDLDWVIVGDGPMRHRLESLELSRVQLRGWQSSKQVSELLSSVRALAFPSRWFEVCPLVILEAFSAGLPVIASRLGALRELVGSVHEDLLVPANGWQRALVDLAESVEVDYLGNRARSRFESHHRLDVHAGHLEQLYSQVTNGSLAD